jgi:hypothetical protein
VKTFFGLLLILNVALFAIQEGYFGHLIPDGRDPGRVLDQISPDKLKLLPSDIDAKSPVAAAQPTPPPAAAAAAPAPASAKTLACVEMGGFSAEDAKRVETQLAYLGLSGRFSERRAEDGATYIVYLPPFKTRSDADRASAELHRIGVNDFYIIQENGPYKLAISLGVFHTEEAAKAQLTTLSQLGVRNAKTGERPGNGKVYFQFRNIDQETNTHLVDLRATFANTDIHECAGVAASAPSSNGM